MTLAYDPDTPPEGARPTFPPLLDGVEVPSGVDPFAKAMADCAGGRAAAGHIYWAPDEDVLRVAVVFEPEEPQARALPILFAAGCALNDCIGALAPPETGLEHVWPDRIRLNGAEFGLLRAASAARDPQTVPGWLVIGLSLARTLRGLEPGAHPDLTALSEEGCGYLSHVRLIESWARHLLVWVNRWEEDGSRPVFEAWLVRARGWQKEIATPRGTGTFLGLDETGAMLLRQGESVHTLPLAEALRPSGWPEDLP